MKDKQILQWWVPMRYQVTEAKREIPKVFSLLGIMRIVLAFSAVFIAAAYLLPREIPGLDFDWFAAFLQCMGALVVILATCCALAFVPPMVTVTPKGIAILQGQTGQHYAYAQLAEVRIDDTVVPYPMLVFRKQSQLEPRRYPISPKINLDDLRALIAHSMR